MVHRSSLVTLAILAVAAGCGDDPPPPYGPTSAPMFEPTHLLEVDIELAPADWDVLRAEHADLFGRLVDGCPGPAPADPFTVFPATVTIDGVAYPDVGVRKKGFLGSSNLTRPSLKLSFDEYQPGREVLGLERLTLNNNQQDPSHLHTCLAYQVFGAAGVPAPRCNWARVTVNGEDLGVYSNVESVRRRFLGLHFARTDGNLYEGQVADLRDGWVDNYEDKNGNDGDRSDLAGLVAAANAPDAGLVDALDPVLDVDAFLTFWATEVLVGHWDGYAGDANNHFLYRDPSTGQFHFLPYGPDSAFGDPDPFMATQPPPSVLANSVLTQRLYALDATHARYQARVRELLASAWDEAALTAEIDRASAMIAPYVHVPAADFEAAVDADRAFVTDQRARVEADLDADPTWDLPLPASYCLAVAGTATGTFTAPYGDFPPSNPTGGSGTLDLVVDGAPVTFQAIFAGAGPDHDPSHPRLAAATFGVLPGGEILTPVMLVEPERWAAGDLRVDGYDVYGVLVRSNVATPGAITMLGFLRGTMTLAVAPTADGEAVSGSFDLELLRRAD